MSNEELVVLIQGGERERLPELRAQVERFVAKRAHRRMSAAVGFGGVEFADLYISGYIAILQPTGECVSRFPSLGVCSLACEIIITYLYRYIN